MGRRTVSKVLVDINFWTLYMHCKPVGLVITRSIVSEGLGITIRFKIKSRNDNDKKPT